MAILNKTTEILATEVVEINRKMVLNCEGEPVSARVRYTVQLQCHNAIFPLQIQTITLQTVLQDYSIPQFPYCRVLNLKGPYEYLIENMPVHVTEVQVKNGGVYIECYYEYSELIIA